jgi:hypothetical protein
MDVVEKPELQDPQSDFSLRPRGNLHEDVAPWFLFPPVQISVSDIVQVLIGRTEYAGNRVDLSLSLYPLCTFY